ncbi:hypothetical protein [Lactobacillus selangorensis]|nr:hypothetical protein [Lactobacillus selangorensis]
MSNMQGSVTVDVILVILYVAVIVCLLIGQSMLSMYLMGIGMLLDAVVCLITDLHHKNS